MLTLFIDVFDWLGDMAFLARYVDGEMGGGLDMMLAVAVLLAVDDVVVVVT